MGTRNQSKRLDGFAIRLTGANAATSHVHYMAHLEKTGDTAWFSDGAFCGTRGESLDVQSITVYVTQALAEPAPPRPPPRPVPTPPAPVPSPAPRARSPPTRRRSGPRRPRRRRRLRNPRSLRR